MVLLSVITYRTCTVTLTLGCLLVCYKLCNAFRDSLVPFTNIVHSLVLAIPADALFSLKILALAIKAPLTQAVLFAAVFTKRTGFIL